MTNRTGAIPGLVQGINSLSEKYDHLSGKLNSFVFKTTGDSNKANLKIKIIWGVGAFLITSIVSVIVAFLVK